MPLLVVAGGWGGGGKGEKFTSCHTPCRGFFYGIKEVQLRGVGGKGGGGGGIK